MTMKKHFLILMLMALLPMVAWADIAFGTVEVGDYTYGGATLPVPVVKDSQGSILTEGTHYEVTYDEAYSDAACETAVALQNMTGKAGSNTYYIKITGKGAYVGKKTSKAFVCNKKDLTIAVTTVFQRNYGSLAGEPANADVVWDAADLVAGEPWSDTKAELGTLTYNYAGKGDVTKAGGEYAISFGGLASDNYNIIYPTDKVFTIVGANMTDAEVAIKAGTEFASMTYKGALFTAADLTGLQLTCGEAVLTQGTDFDVALGTDDAEGAYKNVGDWHYTINFKGNYSGTKANFGTFRVTAAPLSVDVDNIEVTYKGTAYTNDFGTAEVKLNYYGFVASDIAGKADIIAGFTAPTVAVAAAAGATNASETGYALAIDLTGAATNNPNYKFVTPLNTGKLFIKKKEIKFYAKSDTKGPGESDPKFVLDPDALPAVVAGDVLDPNSVTFTRAEGNEVGKSYEITPVLTNAKITRVIDEVTTNVTANYDPQIGTPKGKLTITKAALTITIKDQSKEYGDGDPETIAAPVEGKNYIVTGLVSGDEITSLTLTKSWAAETVGDYILNATVTVKGEEHYSAITVVPGNFEIKKAPLTVTLPIKNVTAGTPATILPQLTAEDITIEGFKKNEDQDEVADYTLAFNTEVGEGKAVLDEGNLIAQTATQGYELKLTDVIFANYAINGKQSAYGKLIVGGGVVDELAFTCVDADAATIAAKAGEKKDVKIKFAPRSGQTLGKARKWAAGEWNTLVLPFDITVGKLSEALGYAIVNVIDNVDLSGDKPVFKFKLTMKGGNGSETVLKANRPFVVKTAEDLNIEDYIGFGEQTIVAPTAADDVKVGTSNIYFRGTYTTKAVTKEDNGWIWFLLGNHDKWAYIKSTSDASWNIVPFAGYIDMSEQGIDPIAAARAIFVMEEIDGTTTAIKGVDMDSYNNVINNAEGWYNLNGMKLQGAPTQKGIYINNGKKVIIK